MIKLIKKNIFLKNSLFYTIGSMMSPIIGFILIPIYTNVLTPSEFGVMNTIQTLVGMFEVFLILSVDRAVIRIYYDFMDDKIEQKQYMGNIISYSFIFATIASILLFVFRYPIGGLLFDNISINPYFIYLIGLSWSSALVLLPLTLLKAQEKGGVYVSYNIISSLIKMGLTLYLLLGMNLGAESALLSQLVINCVGLVVLLSIVYKDILLDMSNFQYVKVSLLFSIPLIPHVASGWIIKSSDRIILESFVDMNSLGIYSLAAQVSMVLALFFNSINNALIPRYTKLKQQNIHDKADNLIKVFFWIVIIFGFLSIPIALFGVRYLITEEYNGVYSLIPLLLVAQIIKGLYFIPLANLVYVKKTRPIAVSSSVAALFNIAINFLLIPHIGLYGAIASTLGSEIIRLTLVFYSSRKFKKYTI